jgi:hypothetical protein
MKHAIAEIGSWDLNTSKVCARKLHTCSNKNRDRVGCCYAPSLFRLRELDEIKQLLLEYTFVR